MLAYFHSARILLLSRDGVDEPYDCAKSQVTQAVCVLGLRLKPPLPCARSPRARRSGLPRARPRKRVLRAGRPAAEVHGDVTPAHPKRPASKWQSARRASPALVPPSGLPPPRRPLTLAKAR